MNRDSKSSKEQGPAKNSGRGVREGTGAGRVKSKASATKKAPASKKEPTTGKKAAARKAPASKKTASSGKKAAATKAPASKKTASSGKKAALKKAPAPKKKASSSKKAPSKRSQATKRAQAKRSFEKKEPAQATTQPAPDASPTSPAVTGQATGPEPVVATAAEVAAPEKRASSKGEERERPKSPPETLDGRRRVVIEKVWPEIDGGRHPIKRVCGESVTVEASIYSDGHELISGRLLHRRRGSETWKETPLEKLVNDRWRATFTVPERGVYEYSLSAWVDRFATWRQDLKKRADAGQELDVELRIGGGLVEEAARAAEGEDAQILSRIARSLAGSVAGWKKEAKPAAGASRRQTAKLSRVAGTTGGAAVAGTFERDPAERKRLADALDPMLPALMDRYASRPHAVSHERVLDVLVERERARYSTWYEMFPRSASREPGRHGTFKDVEARLPYVAEMGFDVLYLPPIHPIGRQFRKGKNNSISPERSDVGSPWAIGGPEGGHKSIHPDLGSFEDFERLVSASAAQGIEIALDIAFQCSPDHPYVKEHPDWFLSRPDGSIQYAENPPKKYQDIYPFYFECEDWRALWRELCSIFLFWADRGVKIFRVDNPHTKPFVFWQWCIEEVGRHHPDVIFLSEAFTRPHPMYKLAKVGFTQSYTYFAWKNTKYELTRWWTETILDEPREFYRPNLWPNTPDILNAHLQHGGRPAFMGRLVLAATMGASYGIYGPAFELVENVPREPGSEEYLDSEKYQLRAWDLDRPGTLRHFIRVVNGIRRAHPCLQTNEHFAFHQADNEQIICYSKRTADGSDVVLTVVNLDPYHVQSGWLDLDLEELGVDPNEPFQAHDLLTGARYLWHGPRAFVSLDPHSVPAHVLSLRHYVRTERDFDYFV